jgi:hypothetical protein
MKIQVEYYSVDYVAKVIVKTFQRNDILNSFVNDKSFNFSKGLQLIMKKWATNFTLVKIRWILI